MTAPTDETDHGEDDALAVPEDDAQAPASAEITDPAARVRAHTKLIALAAGRGGTGRSLLAANLAVYLAQAGKKVVALDADPAGGPLHQLQPRLVRCARPLGQVAVDAAADDVLPGGAPALRAGDDMVQVQLGARQLAPAVLAHVAVAHVDVVAREAHLGLRDAVVKLKHDDARHPDRPVHGANEVVAAVDFDGQLRPALEVEGLELRVDDARDTEIEQ